MTFAERAAEAPSATLMLLNEEAPGLTALVPLKVTVPLRARKVPAFVQFAAIPIGKLLPAVVSRLPAVTLRLPLTWMAESRDTPPPVLLMVRLLNGFPPVATVCDPVPFSTTVAVPAVNVAPEATDQLPATVIWFAPGESLPPTMSRFSFTTTLAASVMALESISRR